MLANTDVGALLAQLSEAVTADPLDRSNVLDLIARGADPNARDEFGTSRFERRLSDDVLSVDAVDLLVEAAAHVNSDGEDGQPFAPVWA